MPIGVALITPSDATMVDADVAGMLHPAPTEACAQAGGERFGLAGVGIDDRELTRAQGEDGMRDRRARAARAEQTHTVQRDITQRASKRCREAGPIGVVTDPLAVLEDDGVDRANGLRIS